MSLQKAMIQEATSTSTENGAKSYTTTTNPVLDLFGIVGGLREGDGDRIQELFLRAYNSSPEDTMRTLFYARDIQEGLGERRVFRKGMQTLALHDPEAVAKNIQFVPEFGRWDDLFCLIGTPVEEEMWDLLHEQFTIDLRKAQNNQPVSLLGKWLPSINASSKKTQELGRKTARAFGMTHKQYRQSLSLLRSQIQVVERKMSDNKWGEIVYSQVPSQAMSRYRSAFKLHDWERFNQFIEGVQQGTEKINTGALFPYNILERAKLEMDYDEDFTLVLRNYDTTIEALWDQLPNYIQDQETRFLVMADTSMSMMGRPILVSLSLALYFAERNKGPFQNLFMTFSEEPQFHYVQGSNLKEKLKEISIINSSTNLEKAFQAILEMAIEHRIHPSEMPTHLVVISDGEIDFLVNHTNELDIVETFKREFMKHGYSLPKIVLWNVESRDNRFLSQNTDDVSFVSGSSSNTFLHLVENANATAEEIMSNILNSERYAMIEV